MVVIYMRLGNSLLLAVVLICGCAAPHKPPETEVDNRPLAPGDCVVIFVDPLSAEGNDNVKRFFLLDPSGDVSLLYVGKIHLAGLTPYQAAKRIHEAYVPEFYKGLNIIVRRCR